MPRKKATKKAPEPVRIDDVLESALRPFADQLGAAMKAALDEALKPVVALTKRTDVDQGWGRDLTGVTAHVDQGWACDVSLQVRVQVDSSAFAGQPRDFNPEVHDTQALSRLLDEALVVKTIVNSSTTCRSPAEALLLAARLQAMGTLALQLQSFTETQLQWKQQTMAEAWEAKLVLCLKAAS